MFTLVHTSDWHLGHTLHDQPRTQEHAAFLAWLVDLAANERADALLVAGDVFDGPNPPAAAQEQLYDFLVALRARCPEIDIVLTGGNHDSAQRLDAPRALLKRLGITMIGGLPRRADRALDLDRLLVPLTGPGGEVAAWLAAVPFLRLADLPSIDGEDPLVEGVAAIYAEVCAAARARRAPGQAILATGHCYLRDGALSELSERKILGGNQHALPVGLFPDDVAYVALGHLHLAQEVGRRGVRYSGSPIPLSMPERSYPHQVCVVTLDGEGLAGVRAARVPRATELLRVPEEGALGVDALEAALRALPPLEPDTPTWRRPFLEAAVRLEAPEPGLQRRVEAALEGRAARLVKLGRERTGTGAVIGEEDEVATLHDFTPEEVFLRRWRQEFAQEPDPTFLACFAELVSEAGHGEGA